MFAWDYACVIEFGGSVTIKPALQGKEESVQSFSVSRGTRETEQRFRGARPRGLGLRWSND